MKIEKKLIHTLPLTVIVGISGLAFVGASIPANEQVAKAETEGISMSIAGDLALEITPEVGGTYAEKTINVAVSTSNENGYTLLFESSSDVAESENGGIASVTRPYSIDNMPVNSWGYYVGTNNIIMPIPSRNTITTLAETDGPALNSRTDVTVGVKVDPTLKSGDYESSLIFTALANEGDCGDGFFCIKTMQEMTPTVCEATTTPYSSATEVVYEYTTDRNYIPRTTLRDTRDGKTYLVSKFSDGNCWMSQNLALELSSSKTLTSSTTALHSISSWRPTNNTVTNANDFEGDILEDHSYKSSTKYLRDGYMPNSTASTSDGKSEWESVGVHYNWIAATAGTGRSLYQNGYDNRATYDSICPRGWHLPERYYVSSFGYRNEFSILASEYYDWNPLTESLAFNAAGTVYVDYNGENSSASDYYGSYYHRSYYWMNSIIEPSYYAAGVGYAESSYLGSDSMPLYVGASIRCVADQILD
jgi:uncharacterized protein (TIGR02145 family)